MLLKLYRDLQLRRQRLQVLHQIGSLSSELKHLTEDTRSWDDFDTMKLVDQGIGPLVRIKMRRIHAFKRPLWHGEDGVMYYVHPGDSHVPEIAYRAKFKRRDLAGLHHVRDVLSREVARQRQSIEDHDGKYVWI